MKKSLSLVLFGLLAGCASSQTARPSNTSPLAMLESLADGTRQLLDLADPSVGIAIARRTGDASGEDPRADAQGLVAVTARACSAGNEDLERLRREIVAHFESPIAEDAPFVCEGLVCNARGPMEFASSLRVVFVEAGPTLRLSSITAVEDVSIVPEIAASRWEDAERGLGALAPDCASAAQ